LTHLPKFLFVEYAPLIFKMIRERFGIENEEYLVGGIPKVFLRFRSHCYPKLYINCKSKSQIVEVEAFSSSLSIKYHFFKFVFLLFLNFFLQISY
jgi:hypothetical protein